MMNVRAASERDLAAMYAVYYLNEVGAVENIPPLSPQNVPAVLRHVFETGTMSVAEQDGRVLAFAGAITRGPVTRRPSIRARGCSRSSRTLTCNGEGRCIQSRSLWLLISRSSRVKPGTRPLFSGMRRLADERDRWITRSGLSSNTPFPSGFGGKASRLAMAMCDRWQQPCSLLGPGW